MADRNNFIVMGDPRWHAKRERLASWLEGDGIEIGALHRPLVVPAAAHVRYVDRLHEADLRQHYPELAEYSFAPVTIIGDAEHLGQIPSDSLDFVVANHLLEHLEYPIRGLAEMLRVLRPGGVLYAAIPDSRMGIDRPRQLTSVEHLLDEHRNGGEANRHEHFKEWVVHAEVRSDGIDERARVLSDMEYSIHFHVWRADTFLDFLVAARDHAQAEFEVLAFSPPEYEDDDEVIVILGKGTHGSPRLPPTPRDSDVAVVSTAPESTVYPRLRQRIARSHAAPVLRPAVRLVRRLRDDVLNRPNRVE